MIDKLSWVTIYPEIVLLVMACIIALVDLSRHQPAPHPHLRADAAHAGVVAVLSGTGPGSERQDLLRLRRHGRQRPDGQLAQVLRHHRLMVTLVYGRPYAADRDMLRGGEMFTLSMFALLGMFVMISGSNFLVIYLGLELLTLSSYALVALRRDNAVPAKRP
jgi:NADH-quinone oxidoreductase subunit N